MNSSHPSNSSRDDVLDLFDHAWQRFRARMEGLGDDEWRSQPTVDEQLTLRWRLTHIAAFLREDRNGPWLGLPEAPGAQQSRPVADSASSALAEVDAAFARWRALLAATTDESLARPIGAAAGGYGDATRRSFALHIADELIHHAAEAALLRDLHAAVT
jgi:hypothetical protein